MGKKRADDEPLEGASDDGGWDSIDALDRINQEIAFLTEIIKLLQVASADHQARGEISLIYVTDEMLGRLELVKKLCKQFLGPPPGKRSE